MILKLEGEVIDSFPRKDKEKGFVVKVLTAPNPKTLVRDTVMVMTETLVKPGGKFSGNIEARVDWANAVS